MGIERRKFLKLATGTFLTAWLKSQSVAAFSASHMRRRKFPPGLYGYGYNNNYQLTNALSTSSNNTKFKFLTSAFSGTGVKLFGGNDAFFAIKADGSLWAWGRNDMCQLGIGTTTTTGTPTRVGTATDWSEIVPGDNSTLALKTDGSLWAWGQSLYGTLGNGMQSIFVRTPIQIDYSSTWNSITCNNFVAAAIRSDGSGYYWGLQSSPPISAYLPTLLTSSPRQIISGGYSHFVLINTVNTAWTVGSGTNYALGNGSTFPSGSTIQIGVGTSWAFGAAGYECTFLISTTGSLYACGYNASGQLGVGTTNLVSTPILVGTGWSKVSPSRKTAGFTLGIKTDNTLWGWGTNSAYQLGLGDTTARSSPTLISSDTDWAKVYAGMYSGYAIKNDGSLYAFGSGTYYALGNGSTANVTTPVKIGTDSWKHLSFTSEFTLGIKADNTLWGWGKNVFGVFGTPYTAEAYYSTPIQVGASNTWAEVEILQDTASRSGPISTASEVTIIARSTSNSIHSWGYSGAYATGLDVNLCISTPVLVDSGPWQNVSISRYHAVGVKSNGTLWSWGCFASGALGKGTTEYLASSPTQIGSATNWSQAVAFAYDGYVGNPQDSSMAITNIASGGNRYSWGSNTFNFGLGVGMGSATSTPVVAPASNWVKISASARASHGIKNDGTLWAWGVNQFGTVGQGPVGTNYSSTPVQIGTDTAWNVLIPGKYTIHAKKSDNSIWSWGTQENSSIASTPIQIGSATDWSTIAAVTGLTPSFPSTVGIKLKS